MSLASHAVARLNALYGKVLHRMWTRGLRSPYAGRRPVRAGGPDFLERLEPRLLLDGAPVPLGVDLLAGGDSGASDDDNLTHVATPVVRIEAAREGDEIRVYGQSGLLGQAVPVGQTLYEYTFTQGQLAEGENVVTARSFDGAEESGDCPALTVRLDTTSPVVAGVMPGTSLRGSSPR